MLTNDFYLKNAILIKSIIEILVLDAGIVIFYKKTTKIPLIVTCSPSMLYYLDASIKSEKFKFSSNSFDFYQDI